MRMSIFSGCVKYIVLALGLFLPIIGCVDSVTSPLLAENQRQPTGAFPARSPAWEIQFPAPAKRGYSRELLFDRSEERLAVWGVDGWSKAFAGESWQTNLRVFKFGSQKPIFRTDKKRLGRGKYAFNQAGSQLAYFDQRNCYAINTNRGEQLAALDHAFVFEAKFINHDRHLVTMGFTKKPKAFDTKTIIVKVWDVASWKEIALKLGPIKFAGMGLRPILSLTTDGRLVFFDSEANSLRCWNLINNKQEFEITSIAEDFNRAFGKFVYHSNISPFEVQIQNSSLKFRGRDQSNRVCVIDYDLSDGSKKSVSLAPLNKKWAGFWWDRNRAIEELNENPSSIFNRWFSTQKREITFWDGTEQVGRITGEFANLIDSAVGSKTPSAGAEKLQVTYSRSARAATVFHQRPLNGIVKIFDADARPPTDLGKGHTEFPIIKLAIANSGKLIATLSRHRESNNAVPVCSIELWDALSVKKRLALEGEHAWLNSIAFSPDGTLLAAGFGYNPSSATGISKFGGGLQVWDVKTGKLKAMLPTDRQIFSVAFGPDSKRLAAGGRERVFLWDSLEGPKTVLQFDDTKSPVFGSNGEKMPQSWQHRYYLSDVLDVMFSSDGQILLGLSGHNSTGAITSWNLAENHADFMLKLGGGSKRLVERRNQSLQVFANLGSDIHLIDLAKRKSTLRYSLSNWALKYQSKNSNDRPYMSHGIFDFCQSKNLLAIAGSRVRPPNSPFVLLQDAGNKAQKRLLQTGMSNLNAVQFNPVNGQLIVAGEGVKGNIRNDLQFFDLDSDKLMATIPNQSNISFAFSQTGKLMASCGLFDEAGCVNLWRIKTGEKVAAFTHRSIKKTIFSPSGNYLITIGPQAIKFWDISEFR